MEKRNTSSFVIPGSLSQRTGRFIFKNNYSSIHRQARIFLPSSPFKFLRFLRREPSVHPDKRPSTNPVSPSSPVPVVQVLQQPYSIGTKSNQLHRVQIDQIPSLQLFP